MKIKLLLAAPRGYCAGVTRAIGIVNQAIEKYGTPLYVNHEIIHNKFIIKSFENKGVIFGEDVKNIPEKSIVVFSAHGVGPEYIQSVKDKKLHYIDASCPLVIKVHTEAKKYLSEGYEIIYIGKKGHQEAEGIIEEGRGKIHIISKGEDIEVLKNKIGENKKIALLTQTTLSVDETKKLIESTKEIFPQIVLPKAEDICYATTNRQKAVKEIVNQSNLLIIVGSKNSSNSSKLRDIGEKEGVKSVLIDSYKELDKSMIKGIVSSNGEVTIGLSGGASAPEHLIQEVITYLESIGEVEIEEIKTADEKIVFPSNLVLQK